MFGSREKNDQVLQFVENQTPELCLEAVKQNGLALRFVETQTPEICLEAVRNDGWALQYVNEQTEELYLEAAKQDGTALFHVKKRTPRVCLEALKKHGSALHYVKEQTEEICLEALFSEGMYKGKIARGGYRPIYDYIKSPTKEMMMIKDILIENKSKSYRQIRSQLVNREIELNDSPYHVLERLYSH